MTNIDKNKSILGALFIVFATIMSRMANHVYLSPLFFSVGIILVIIFDAGLITGAIPGGRNILDCISIGVDNMAAAMVIGAFVLFNPVFQMQLSPAYSYFIPAIGTGIIIGLVSILNSEEFRIRCECNMENLRWKYWAPLTFILIYIFVYLGLPHCVVYAFLLPAALMVNDDGINVVLTLVVVIVGNVIGGYLIRRIRRYL